MDGLEVLKRLRKRGSHLPVMILTARDAIADRVAGLDSGADDYMPKPFAVLEFQARLRALVRRHHGGAASACLELGKLRYDTVTRAGFSGWHGKSSFPAASGRSCPACCTSAGKVISKQALTSAISSWDATMGSNAVEVYIHRLRKKLEPAGISIRTVRGLGYLIESSDDRPD